MTSYFVDMFITSVVLCCLNLATGVVVSTIPFYLVCVCVSVCVCESECLSIFVHIL